jgi:diguanylate cyclase (GGDEF)-like protein
MAVEIRVERIPGAAAQRGRHRVLIIDDNPAIHEDIRRILTSASSADDLDQLSADLFGDALRRVAVLPFEIDSAYQGEEGLALVERAVEEQRPYAVAFVDVRMPPGWDGIQTIGHLWRTDPCLQVVICTAYSDHSWEQIIGQLGQSDNLLILKKPFDNSEVLQVTHALARKWSLHRAVFDKMNDLEQMVNKRTRALELANEQLKLEVAERRRAEEHLKHLATHDSLTNLPNRMLMRDRLSMAIARARRQASAVALLFVDLDHFKEINDKLGHEVGDRLLTEVARRLVGTLRECDTVARMGGDEFVVVLGDLANQTAAACVTKRIAHSLAAPFTVDNHTLNVTASIGIALFPDDCGDVEQLMKCADMAMYEAKERGRNRFCFYGEGSETRTTGRVALGERLERALAHGEFELWYQPLYDLESGKISEVEALLRWRVPEDGVIRPMEFIPAVEQSGLIVPIGAWVLETACRQNRAWQDAGLPRVPVAVNVSPRQLHSPDFVKVVQRSLAASGLEPAFLEIEVTESAAMADAGQARKTLHALHDLGVRIVIDDFGAGYSSLNRLKSLPVHALKIDRFFLQDVADDARDAAIVAAIVSMAHSLGIQVIAEGVETAAQLAFLRSLKQHPPATVRCDKVQGFLFSRPVPADEAAALLGQDGTPTETRWTDAAVSSTRAQEVA